jgi:hypothetical protein
MFKSQIVKLVGVFFEGAQDNIRQWGCPDIGTYALVREKDNPHDPNAIRVALFGHFYMGYLPKHLAQILAPMIDSGRKFIAEFVRVNRHPYHEEVGLTIRIVEMVPAQ